MMDNILYISYKTRGEGHGSLTIRMDNMHKFFSLSDFRKILKIIRLDWQHEDELMEKLKSYLQKRVEELESISEYRYLRDKKENARIIKKLEKYLSIMP